MFLGFHPDISVSKALFQILGAAYPEDTFLELRTYILRKSKKGVTPGVYLGDRVRYLYALMLFIRGTDAEATQIKSHIAITSGLDAIRRQTARARAAYNSDMARDMNLAGQGLVLLGPMEELFQEPDRKAGPKRTH